MTLGIEHIAGFAVGFIIGIVLYKIREKRHKNKDEESMR